MGFTFDDTNSDATPITEMHSLIEKDPRNTERIFPYIGGEEVNTSPTHAHNRYVISFGEMNEADARQYQDLMAIVEAKVKPQRSLVKRDVYRNRWWQFAEKQIALYRSIAQCDRVLVIARTSKSFAFTLLASHHVFSENLIVFAFPNPEAAFPVLQSRIHEIWVRFFSSSLKDDLGYRPTDCFETFPFPPDWETNPTLEAAGKTCYEFRADLMVRHNQGLTATYNRFHDPDETNPDILKLRELHAECDRAVLDAYGWQDIPTTCEFLLDYEDEDPEGTSKRKKPWRYRWSETVHDEVLARLLKLNQERATDEIQGRTKRRKEPAKTATASSIYTVPHTPKQLDLIPPDTQQLDLL